MNTKTFTRKLALLARLKDELDDIIVCTFNRYIADRRINFNGMDTWEVQYDNIFFRGTDGCRGHYDSMCLDIPMKYFLDYDKHTEEDRVINTKKEKEKKTKEKREIEAKEKELLKQLKEKYE